MIKFILAVIAMIFVALAAYMYMNPKEAHAPVTKTTQKTETSMVKKETPSVEKESVSAKAEVVSEKKVDVKPVEKVVEIQNSDSAEVENDIGKGLTLEGIQSMDVSEEEKERLRDDMFYQQSFNMKPSGSLDENEILKIIEEDLKNSRNQ